MGQVFGRTGAAEPPYQVLLFQQHSQHFSYEIRRYSARFAVEAPFSASGGSPFMTLARYIGVFGTPENEARQTISMTVPVVKKETKKIAMTVPVVKSEGATGKKVMDFILPAEFDDINKIPKPTNPNLGIKKVPPAVGAVHRYSGSMEWDHARDKALLLAQQLQKDGLSDLTEEEVLQHYQFWIFTPPFSIPVLRRNEVWFELKEEQVNRLVNREVTVTASN